MAYLLITSGAKAGTSFHLKKLPLVGGREVTRDIQLLDPKVSRKHFVIRKGGDAAGYEIAEQDAKNGVFLNGKRITAAKLMDGDRIAVGETEMVFVDGDDEGKLEAIRQSRVLSQASAAPTVVAPRKQ